MNPSNIQLSVIIPILNESKTIIAQLQCLQKKIKSSSANVEIIVVDGGSDDSSAQLATPYADIVLSSARGRALQMNAGATVASGDSLLFLHSDTVLPDVPFPFLHNNFSWGFYYVRLSGASLWFRIIETMICLRSRLTRVATGDQCLFIKTSVFKELQGFASIPLMEDVEISKRLRKKYIPMIVQSPVVTSSRRWEKKGMIKTILLMWLLRALYFFGVSPEKLHRYYYQ